MKTLRFLIPCFLAMTAAVCHAQITDPGWFRAGSQPASVEARSGFSQSQVQSAGQLLSPNQPAVPVAEAITPQIQALADGLQDNPTNIFDYVHDHIKFVLYFGSKKGAELTLLEKSGNDFDQCALLVALLSAAGYSNDVAYQFGWQQIPYDDPSGHNYDLHHWWQLTLDNTNWTTTYTYLGNLVANRGYPLAYYLGDGNTFEIQRTWVALTIGSTTYQLDPAFKISEPVSGISLTNAMGSGAISNTLLNAAAGTDTGTYAQDLNEAAMRSQLTAYTTNFLNYLQSNAPNASVQQILGGWQIVPAYNPLDYGTSATFPVDTFGGQMPVLDWTYEPTNLMSTLQITFAGISYQWFMPQLQGQRLALTFDGSGNAQLWQDDTLLAQNATSGNGTTNVVLYAHHPSGSWDTTNNVFIDGYYDDQTVTNAYQSTNATYALLYAFEPDWGWLQQRENILDAYLAENLPNSSRQVTSETLNIMGLSWMLQTAQAERMLAAQLGILPMFYHRLGRMAQETGKGYYVDVYMQLTGEYPNGGSDPAHILLSNTHFDLFSFFASALEYGLIQQLQNSNLVAASTVKMLEIANANGQPIYLASSNNWSAVQNDLVNYNSSTLATIGGYTSQNYYVLLPQNGSNQVASAAGSWAGYGYEARQAVNGAATESKMIISGGYNGGYVSSPTATPNVGYTDQTAQNQPGYFDSTPVSTPSPTIADPVDTQDGTFQIQNPDASIGQGGPTGITFIRYYNSTRRYTNPAWLGYGWIFNYYMNANAVAAPQAGLGETTPAQAASMLTATAAAIAMYNGGYPDPKNWTVTALIAKWGVDQLINNGVTINLGKDTWQFVQQPNGVFTPPANCTMTLAENNSIYTLQERHGRTFHFDYLGWVTNIVDQYNRSTSLFYSTSPHIIYYIQDWKGRGWRLASDILGVYLLTRILPPPPAPAVSFSYDSNTNLSSVEDQEGDTTTYTYDTNNQITATVDAENRLVVSNFYDSQGHLTTQYSEGETNMTWRIFWSGWQTVEQNPAGGQRIFSYDDQGRLVSAQDQLGNLTQTFYDGQNHIVQTVSPLDETNQYFYDGNNNLIETIDPLGFTNQFIYDANNDLVETINPRGDPTTFGYNSEFSVIGQTNGAGDWVNDVYTTSGALAGTLASRTDPGGTTTYGYDSYGQLSSITYPNSLGVESYANDYFGNVTNYTDARSFVTAYQYNNRRQLTNTVAATNLTTQIAYDPVGNVLSTTDAHGNVTAQTWSATRKLLATTLPAMSVGTPIVTNIYDNREWLIGTLDPLQNPTRFTNDPAGRLISETDPLSRTTTFGYDRDSRKTAATNGANETTYQTWDAKSELIDLIDGAGHISVRGYDGAGNQITLINRNTNTWHFYFDGANRLTNTVSPLLRSTSVVFNHQGLPALVTSPLSITTNGYDAKGRLTNRADSFGATLYRYDADDNLTNVSEHGLNNTWTFDAYDRVSSYADVYGNLIQYRYDANGNLTNLIYPGNRNVYYSYDSNNHMTTVTDWSGRKTTMTYDLDGHLTGIYRPNGTYRTISYDSVGEVTNILEQMANGLPIALMRYNWDLAARMDLDFIAPLPHTNSPPPRSMSYDSDNELATVDGDNVSVDADGNLTYGPLTNEPSTTTYTYDVRNRLQNAGGVTNFYDAMNNRIGQTFGTNSIEYIINPNAALPQVLERIKDGVTTYYIYGPGLLYQITEAPTGTNTLTYHYDYRGSTIALTGDNGLATDRMEYSLYGTMTYRAGTNDTPFLFAGSAGVQSDPDGLLYMRARYYNPHLCRFLNPDPKGFTAGMNFYVYANGNPANNVDPSGLQIPTPVTVNYGWQNMGQWGSEAQYDQQVQAANEQATALEASALGGYAVGAASAAAVGVGATALVSAGVPQSVVTGGLFVTGVAGVTASGYSIYNNPSPDNIAFNAGGLAGALAVGGYIANNVASALSPSGYQPSGPASLDSELSMVWTDNNGNPNPLSMLPAWLLPGADVGPMSTGPSTLGAAGAIGGAGSGVAAGASLLFGSTGK